MVLLIYSHLVSLTFKLFNIVILSCLTLFNLLSARNVLHQRYNMHPTYPEHFDTQFDTTCSLNLSLFHT